MKSHTVCVFAFALIFVLGCSAQVTVEGQGTGSADGTTTATPTAPTDPVITTSPLPVHEPGAIIVTDENDGPLASVKTGEATDFLWFANQSLGNDADFGESTFVLNADDGGSVVSWGGHPYFDHWTLWSVAIDGTATFVGNGMMQIVTQTELRVRFTSDLFVADGTKVHYKVTATVAPMPSKDEAQQLLDHEYQLTKVAYAEGDILDGNDLVIPLDEIAEDAPMLGNPRVVIMN